MAHICLYRGALFVQGFYGVYSSVFSMLAEQELTAWQQTEAAGAPNATPPKFAPFGSSDSPAAEVFAFYNNWGSFVTCKEFAWADLYNPAAAPNRQVGISIPSHGLQPT